MTSKNRSTSGETNDVSRLQDYIHEQIPITAGMGVRVLQATPDIVELAAPLEANINHRETVFGGSASAIATLAAWTLVLVRMQAERLPGRLVIAGNSMRYQHPITADFTATALAQDLKTWSKLTAGVERKGRGRVRATSHLWLDGQQMAEFEGQFVAICVDT